MKHLFGFFAASFFIISCQNAPEQTLESLDKKSAREVTLTTVTKNDTVFHITKQSIWLNGEQIAQHSDTVVTTLKPNTWGSESSETKLNEIPIYVTVQ